MNPDPLHQHVSSRRPWVLAPLAGLAASARPQAAARRVGLRGANAGELRIVQSTKNLLVLNLRTMKAPGLPPPASLLTWAEEIIE